MEPMLESRWEQHRPFAWSSARPQTILISLDFDSTPIVIRGILAMS
jgi:hypothetical protein